MAGLPAEPIRAAGCRLEDVSLSLKRALAALPGMGCTASLPGSRQEVCSQLGLLACKPLGQWLLSPKHASWTLQGYPSQQGRQQANHTCLTSHHATAN